MKRPLVLFAAPLMLMGKSAAVFYVVYATAENYRPSMFLQPLLFLVGAVWLYFQPKWARWPAGAFFAYAAIHQCVVLPSLQGSTIDLVRRPFSLAVAAWFVYSLLGSRSVREFSSAPRNA